MRQFGFNAKAALTVLLLVIIAVEPGMAASGYHVIKKDTLGGEGGWDYLTLDQVAHRLFLSHSTHVMVVDLATSKVVGDIPNTTGIHGVALVQDLGKGFTSNGRDSSVTIFDLKTLATLGMVRVGQNPDDIFYDPASKHVFTLNGGSHDASVIDPAKGNVVGNIKFDGRPEFAVTDGSGHYWVDLEDISQVITFESGTLKVDKSWPLAPGEEPTGMALDAKRHRLFVGCANQLMVIMNSEDGHVIDTVPIGSGVDGVAYDQERGLIFSSNGEGTLTVIKADSADRYTVLENVPTQKGARTMTLDPTSHRIYTVSADFGPPPAPTADRPHPRPSVIPGTFVLLTVGQ